MADLEDRIRGNLSAVDNMPVERAFGARKKIKRLRGLWRLLRMADDARAAAENDRLRMAGQRLGPLRDGDVTVHLLNTLASGDPERERLAQRHLDHQPQALEPAHPERALAETMALFAERPAKLDASDVRLAKAIATGLAHSRRSLRKRLAEARRARGADRTLALHRLRRAVKYHWMAQRLLGMADADIARTKAVADLLGQYQDLAMLKARLKPDAETRAAFAPLIAERMKALRKRVLAQAAVFGGKAGCAPIGHSVSGR